jgi:hypothetical protein
MSTDKPWEIMDPSGRIAVIGSGPAGLLSAWAAIRAGYYVEIFTNRKAPTMQTGAQYVHMNIPGITSSDEAQPIQYSHIGTAEGYAEKIYGGALAPDETSWYKFEGEVPAWPMSEVYQRLWKYFEDVIIEAPVDLGRLEQIARHNFAVFSSMPLNVLLDPSQKASGHFKTEMVFTYPKMVTPGYKIGRAPNVIVYNGAGAGWYRQSRIFGKEWTEWPQRMGLEAIQAEITRYGHEYNSLAMWQVAKPVVCTLPVNLLLPPNVRLIGRYGQWRKGVLVHDAYVETTNFLESARSSASGTSHVTPG